MRSTLTTAVFPVAGLGTRFDCGNQEGFLQANVAYALAQARKNGDTSLQSKLRHLLD